MTDKLLYGVPGGGTYTSAALSDSGDAKTFNFGTIEYLSAWSKDDLSYDASVVVDGVVTGGVGIPAVSGTNNLVDAGALTANLGGVEYRGSTVLAADTDLSITRGGVGTEYIINSITHTGAAWAVVAGTGGAAFDLAGGRGGAGEPPYIPVGSIEVFQTRTTTSVDAAILASEIHQVKGDSMETYNFPGGKIEYARLTNNILGYAGYTFKAALPKIHTGDTTKKIYMTGYEETFAEWVGARAFQPQGTELTSTTETAYNNETKSSSDKSLSTGSMEWLYDDAVTDAEWDAMEGKTWFKYYQDTSDTWYQAYLGIPNGQASNNATGVNVSSITLTGGQAVMRVKG